MIKIQGESMREFRCTKCRKLLGLEYIRTGRLQIVCPRCKEVNYIDFRTIRNELLKIIKGGDK